MAPEYVPIPEWPGHSISRAGIVLGKRGKPLAQVRHWTHGGKYFYLSVCLTRDGKPYKCRVHQLVMKTFGDPKPFPKAEIRHRNGDKMNNNIRNLAWGTHQENMDDRRTHGQNWNSNKTHCPKKHEYTPENTYVLQTTSGIHRFCRTCRRNRNKRSD